MSEATFCPAILLPASIDASIDETDQRLGRFLSDFADECKIKNVELKISSTIFQKMQESFPWQGVTDVKLLQYSMQWRLAVTGLFRQCTDANPVYRRLQQVPWDCELSRNRPLFAEWLNWVLDFYEGAASFGLSRQGLHLFQDKCTLIGSCSCNLFTTVLPPINLNKVINPWYHLYPPDLPCEGDHPFIPPANWSTFSHAQKGTNHGYLDSRGDEWVPDNVHGGPHWDVQSNRSRGHVNVSFDGTEL